MEQQRSRQNRVKIVLSRFGVTAPPPLTGNTVHPPLDARGVPESDSPCAPHSNGIPAKRPKFVWMNVTHEGLRHCR